MAKRRLWKHLWRFCFRKHHSPKSSEPVVESLSKLQILHFRQAQRDKNLKDRCFDNRCFTLI